MKRGMIGLILAAVVTVAAAVLNRIKLSEIGENPKARSSRKGTDTRLNSPASKRFAAVGKAHGFAPRFPWAAVHESEGYFWLTPTDEDDLDRLHVRWEDGGHTAVFSLAKVWQAVQIRVPKGHALVMDVDVKDHPEVLTALRICYENGKVERIETRQAAPQAKSKAQPQAKVETQPEAEPDTEPQDDSETEA